MMNPAEDDNESSSTFSKDPPTAKQAADANNNNNNNNTSLEWKERGNALYGKREFEEAAKAYQAGLDALLLPQKLSSTTGVRRKDTSNNGCNEEEDLAVALRSNLAIALIKLGDFDGAEQECTTILDSHAPNTKGTKE